MGRVVVSVAAVVVAVASSGCGSDGGGKDVNVGGPTGCGQVAPCGGDLTGTWMLTTACITADGLRETVSASGCPGISVEVSELNTIGKVTFSADGTYSTDGLSAQTLATVSLPVACAIGGSCQAEEESLQSDETVESGTCSGTSTCVCTAREVQTDSGATGTFSISGTTVTLDGGGLLGEGGSYCVEGTHLHLISPTAGGKVGKDFVAIKQ